MPYSHKPSGLHMGQVAPDKRFMTRRHDPLAVTIRWISVSKAYQATTYINQPRVMHMPLFVYRPR